MVFRSIFRFFQNLFRSVKYSIMGDCADAKLVSRVTVPPIPKLGDMHMYWVWRMLIKSYLDAIGLWSGNHPKESAHTKFVLLSTLEIWVVRREYDEMSSRSIFEDLEERYAITNNDKRDSMYNF
uniref:Uncharacterized protein n=2 Tax=Drosophila melanogaster TaxID=7227 RepID=Q8INB5_DROME|nr:uncharacterized protein Dmel_CG42446 [Drosophila melanogaster]AAN13706.3 uncharacterized protein Dmel_CG42446 [Drosophila melanogaster]|eukprot:NP_650537.3 uncharacterized protein Dmel_CG42446 [Drosophila melanogaster]